MVIWFLLTTQITVSITCQICRYIFLGSKLQYNIWRQSIDDVNNAYG